MTTDRRFCRSAWGHNPLGIDGAPEDGLCLSAFVIVSPATGTPRVLAGHLNPFAPWDHLGGLSPEQIEVLRNGWQLPASHLLLLEGPDAATQRILRERVGGLAVSPGAPRVTSEVYTPVRRPAAKNHWEIRLLPRGITRRVPASCRGMERARLRRTGSGQALGLRPLARGHARGGRPPHARPPVTGFLRAERRRRAPGREIVEVIHPGALRASMTEKCEYCGDSLADDWVACPKCGKPKYGGKPLVEIANPREPKPT